MAVLPLPTERTVALIITANGPSLARLNCFGFSGPTFAPFFAFAGFVAFAAFLLAFAFFRFAVSFVVSCVLIVVLLCV